MIVQTIKIQPVGTSPRLALNGLSIGESGPERILNIGREPVASRLAFVSLASAEAIGPL